MMQNKIKTWLINQQIFTNHDELLGDLQMGKVGDIALIPQFSLENKYWRNVKRLHGLKLAALEDYC